MMQNWTTTLIDDTNLFMRLYSFESLFIFILLGISFVMIVRNVRNLIILDAMSKNLCSKIASLFEIQHDVSFRRISVQ